MAVRFASTKLSLAKPAWDSLSLVIPSKPKEACKFAFIRTIHAVYDRVEIIEEDSSIIYIQFLGRAKDKKGKLVPKQIKEMLKKSEIIVMRNYTD